MLVDSIPPHIMAIDCTLDILLHSNDVHMAATISLSKEFPEFTRSGIVGYNTSYHYLTQLICCNMIYIINTNWINLTYR